MTTVIGSVNSPSSNLSISGSAEQQMNVSDVGVYASGEVVTQVRFVGATASDPSRFFDIALYKAADISVSTADATPVWQYTVEVDASATFNTVVTVSVADETLMGVTAGDELAVVLLGRTSGSSTPTIRARSASTSLNGVTSSSTVQSPWVETGTGTSAAAVEVTLDSGVATPTLTTDADEYSPGDEITAATTGLSTITISNLSRGSVVMDIVINSDTSYTIPDFITSDQQAQLFSDPIVTTDLILTVGDGTLTATKVLSLNPKTGYAQVTYNGITGTPDILDSNYLPAGSSVPTIVDGDQIRYLATSPFTYLADGSTTYDPADLGTSYTELYTWIKADTGIMYNVIKNYLDGEPVDPVISRVKIRRSRKIRNKTYWLNGLLKPKNYGG